MNGLATHRVSPSMRVCVYVHIYKNGCASTHTCVCVFVCLCMNFNSDFESWQNFQTIWEHFIGVIVVIVASRSLYSRFMSFPFAPLRKRSFCSKLFAFLVDTRSFDSTLSVVLLLSVAVEGSGWIRIFCGNQMGSPC